MCLVIFALNSHPRYPLLLAANRDEFYARPTAPARFLPEHPGLLAGRDLQAGGTWMGITRSGRFAAVTNFRDPARGGAAPRSRGGLPMDFLLGGETPAQFLSRVVPEAAEYGGFNLLVGTAEAMWYYSNSGGESAPRALGPGVYGLSNAVLDTPWPKLELGKRRLRGALAGPSVDHDALLAAVSDRSLAEPGQLHPLGLSEAMDRQLSAQFICARDYDYGTRSSTTLWLDAERRASWREITWDREGSAAGSHREDFSLE